MNYKYATIGLLAFLLWQRGASVSAGQRQVVESIPVNGTDVFGDAWLRSQGYGFGGAAGGVNTCGFLQ